MVEFKEITSRKEFDDEITKSGDKVVFLKFQGEWCGPCKAYAENIKSLPEEYSNKLIVLEADVDKAEDLAEEFNIRSIPTTFIYFKGEEKSKLVGLRTKENIIEEIDNILK